MRQVNWREHLFCLVNRKNFTQYFTIKNFNFSLLSAATFLLPHIFRSSYQRSSVKKGVLRHFAKFIGKSLRQNLAQVFYYEFWGISKNTLLTEQLQAITSDILYHYLKKLHESFKVGLSPSKKIFIYLLQW